MESLIPISELNDFVFCPRSLYFHHLYGGYSTAVYHDTPQTKGNIAHEAIDEKKYSTSKKWLQGLEVSSETLGIIGKIDLYNEQTGELVERKRKIIKVYDGYKLQAWAQAACLEEMGYRVQKIFLHSLSDNKRYEIEAFPIQKLQEIIADHIQKMRSFSLEEAFSPTPEKCAHCIYSHLCDQTNS
jgi:CRISPR-associated exonuclease Cas4